MTKYKVLPYIDADKIFNLVANIPGTIFLDSSQKHSHYGHYSYILVNPKIQYITSDLSNLQDDLATWHNVLEQYKTEINPDLPPFTGGLCGYLSYDLSKKIESIPSTRSSTVPDYMLGLYNQVFAFDHEAKKCFIMVTPFDCEDPECLLKDLFSLYNKATDLPFDFALPLVTLKSDCTQTQYIKKVQKAREYILDGDIFEVNLSQCFSATIKPDYPLHILYKKLRSVNKAPFSAFLNLGKLKILSASPERFLSITNRHIETRPIKGTIARGSDPIEDKRLRKILKNSAKDRAENIMIVDLMRNDLGKICILGSVTVTSLCEVESFTNVHHLISVVEGDLEPHRSILDVIPACFPGGSITGAPKIQAQQIIEELENCNRGVYSGSIGYFGFNGNVDLSIAIRTIVADNDSLSFHVGGAITLDSDALTEYNETLLKAQKLIEAINVL